MNNWPKITVVTPSYNQCEYLEPMIRSVLDENYPNLEFIIVDGGSTDGSVDIIRKYEDQLAWWVSEPDEGQSHAINKGLKRATGDWLAWQNSDDLFFSGVFHGFAEAVASYPKAKLIIGDMMLVDQSGDHIRDIRYVRPTYKSLLAEGMVLTNQSAFWHKSVHDEIGYLSEDLHYGFDYEWFLRVTKQVDAAHVSQIWGALRLHEDTKTSQNAEKFMIEYDTILEGRRSTGWQKFIYKTRRFMLMLMNGQFSYIARGTKRRTLGKNV